MARLKPLWDSLADVATRLRRVRRLLVASDYDGTLTPIVSHPREAGLAPRTRRALGAIARLDGAEVAILSGRSLADLGRRVRLPGIHLSGGAGYETRSPGGRVEVHVPAGREVPDDLRRELRAFCRGFAGAQLEDKVHIVAVHYRRLAAPRQAEFVAGVRRRVADLGPGVRLVAGRKVLEVLPGGRWTKASALSRWWRGGLVVFLGDDAHDEPVHAWVRRRRGIAVAVGREASRAEYALPSVEEVTWWLEWLAREWREVRATPRAASRAPSP